MKDNRWIILTVALVITACGGAEAEEGTGDDDLAVTTGDEEVEPGDSTEGHQSARELIGIHPPQTPWDEMSHEDKEMDMVARFHPIFREMFQEFDAEEFAGFGCEDCHGSDMREREFAMPSPHLPAVPLPGTDAYRDMADDEEEEVRFMEQEVTPAMQTMLGMGATFTCNGCHPSAAAEASAPLATF